MSSVKGFISRAVSPNDIVTPIRIASPVIGEILTQDALLSSLSKVEPDDAFKFASDNDKHEKGYASDATGARKKYSYGKFLKSSWFHNFEMTPQFSEDHID